MRSYKSGTGAITGGGGGRIDTFSTLTSSRYLSFTLPTLLISADSSIPAYFSATEYIFYITALAY